jgi:hypothetical protein
VTIATLKFLRSPLEGKPKSRSDFGGGYVVSVGRDIPLPEFAAQIRPSLKGRVEEN